MDAPPTLRRAPPGPSEIWLFICYDRGHEVRGAWADDETPRCALMVPCITALCPVGFHTCRSPLIRKERA